jgi:chaperonin GroEL (HSP60 family)
VLKIELQLSSLCFYKGFFFKKIFGDLKYKYVPLSYSMRKEVNLDQVTINILQSKADKIKRSLKNYMETVLVAHAKMLEKRNPSS